MGCQRKVLIASKGRPIHISTHLYLEKSEIDYRIILHNEEEKRSYIRNKTIDPKKIIVSGAALCLPAQREWMRKNLCEDGEWAIFLDDNIETMCCVQSDHYKKEQLDSDLVLKNPTVFRSVFNQPINAKKFLERCEEMIQHAESKKAFLCGFATVENPLFRCKKYKYFSYVIGKAIIRKKTIVEYPEEWFCQEDYHDTASHLLAFGKVLVNAFIKPQAKHYQAGGIGNYQKRLPYKIDLNKKLMQKFPGLFRYKEKKDCPPGSEIVITLTSEKQIENWRKNFK